MKLYDYGRWVLLGMWSKGVMYEISFEDFSEEVAKPYLEKLLKETQHPFLAVATNGRAEPSIPEIKAYCERNEIEYKHITDAQYLREKKARECT